VKPVAVFGAVMLHESPHGRNQSIEGLPLEVLGLVASKLRSDTNKRPGTELIACVSRKCKLR
jgi:hypothetical protein